MWLKPFCLIFKMFILNAVFRIIRSRRSVRHSSLFVSYLSSSVFNCFCPHVCRLVTTMYLVKIADLIDMPFGMVLGGQKERYIRCGYRSPMEYTFFGGG